MKDKVYFPGLNGIRFFAALSVIFFHISDTNIFGSGSKNFFLSKLVFNGNDAVTLFFVLSGFLITYLLLVEVQQTNTVQVKKFYWRRILRIWPLYYFLVFCGFVVVPLLERLVGTVSPYSLNMVSTTSYLFKLGAYVVLLPHVAVYLGHSILGIEQLWSIGVEENFYLIWPALFKWFSKKILTVLLLIIGFKLVCNLVFALLYTPSNADQFGMQVLGLINYIRVENMAVGGIGAYILFTKKSVLQIIFHPIVEKLVLVVVAVNILFFTGQYSEIINFSLSVVYLLLIMNVSSNPKSTLKIEHPILNNLGRISYGIYMYHVLVIFIVGLVLSKTNFSQTDNPLLTFILYIGIAVTTILIAHVSYYYFEQPFLRRKQRYTVVESGKPELAS